MQSFSIQLSNIIRFDFNLHGIESAENTQTGLKNISLPEPKSWLFRALTCATLWENTLRDKEVNKSWETFRYSFLRAQELSILILKKLGRKAKA